MRWDPSGKPTQKTGYRWETLPLTWTPSYALAAAFSIPVRHFLLGQQESLSVWVTRFFGFRGTYYGWYVEMYIGLALLSPFLNRLLEALPDREVFLLALVLLFLTALPGATPMVLVPAY